METIQLDLFSTNYAESGNTNQLSSTPCDQQLVEKRNTDDCSLFLPAAGWRNSDGSMNNEGTNGNYWSTTPNGSNAYNLNFNSSGNININNNNRNNGNSVRCVKAFTKEGISSPLPVFHITKEQLLIDVFKAYYDARKHKRNTHNQLMFEIDMEDYLVQLRDELFDYTYKVGRSTCFIIEDPVKREIFAADFKDRVVHHLVYNYIMPIFEKTFIEDSYSCRKGKGTLFGIKRLEHHIRSCSRNYSRPCYVMKMDIQGYFMNIERQRLLDIVTTDLMNFADRKSDTEESWGEKLDYSLIFYLLEEIIMNDPTEDCVIKGKKSDWNGLPANKSLFQTPDGCGLPIGNLTSQLFSNIYLNRLDQLVKREFREKHYGRYVDDFFIVSRQYAKLKLHKRAIQQYLSDKLGLTLHPKKSKIIDERYGVSFLGAFIKPYRKYIDNKTKRRIIRKTSILKDCQNAETLRASINSYLGCMKHYKCCKTKKELFSKDTYWEKYGFFIGDFSNFCLFPPIINEQTITEYKL